MEDVTKLRLKELVKQSRELRKNIRLNMEEEFKLIKEAERLREAREVMNKELIILDRRIELI